MSNVWKGEKQLSILSNILVCQNETLKSKPHYCYRTLQTPADISNLESGTIVQEGCFSHSNFKKM